MKRVTDGNNDTLVIRPKASLERKVDTYRPDNMGIARAFVPALEALLSK